ncbi:MAG: Mov34/MPN/PAD-1 family protein [Aggregatilineales bacterium]
MAIVLAGALQRRIFEQVERAYPNEGGGFLLGATSGSAVRIADAIPVANAFAAEEQRRRYAMTPQDWARLEDEADRRGLTLVGYYHSHPDAPAVPSAYDRDHALPNFAYLIASVRAGAAVEMRAWRLRPDRTQFDPDTLTIA